MPFAAFGEPGDKGITGTVGRELCVRIHQGIALPEATPEFADVAGATGLTHQTDPTILHFQR